MIKQIGMLAVVATVPLNSRVSRNPNYEGDERTRPQRSTRVYYLELLFTLTLLFIRNGL